MIFNQLDKNWIYRYREYNPLTLKELIYQEIYFSTKEELNDPFDYAHNLVIPKNSDFIHEYFIQSAIEQFGIKANIQKKIRKEIVNTIANDDIYTDLIELSLDENYLEEILQRNDISNTKKIISSIYETYHNLKPKNLRSISFSKSCENPVLWTHYAKAHTGFCMIFKPTNKHLFLKKIYENKFEKYKCEFVKYNLDINVDLSLMFNKNKKFDWRNFYRDYYPQLNRKALLTKHPSHSKESEVRITSNYNIATFGSSPSEEKQLPKHEQIYYFDPKQFVGVVLGHKMKDEHKYEITSIISKSKAIKNYKIFEILNFVNGTIAILNGGGSKI
ncbi:MAG: hypothetical protein C0448_16280 [Sphingobacteriaceae bacterium]|nr:hypothetical protein [Sphingobacteriaceae bacterium]